MFRNCLLIFIFANLSALAAVAQGSLPPPADASVSSSSARQRTHRTNLGSPEAEMLERARIRHEEKTHEELCERAEEAAKLGGSLLAAFEANRAVGRDDFKKLERVEKLVKKIRSAVGGTDDKSELQDPPARLDQAVARLAELTVGLNEEVKKTSRLVVSGSVIERSTQLIELIRHTRSLLPR